MTSTATPVYGSLVSFGSFEFSPKASFISQANRNIPRPLSYILGMSLGQDTNANAPMPYKSQENTWTVYFIAPDGTAEDECAAYVQAQYQALEYYLVVPDPSTGLSQQQQTLTVQYLDGSTASCQAQLVDMSFREADRSYSWLSLNCVFQYVTEWS